MRTTFVLIALLTRLAYAQTTTTLFGTVTDKTGAVVPGARVTAQHAGTNQTRSVDTNTQGEYRMDFMPIGAYSVEVSAAGFKKFVQKGVVLEINVPSRVDVQLEVGQITDSVEVVA